MVIRRETLLPEHVEFQRGATGRPPVSGTQGIVSSGHHLVSLSGMKMLLNGGNAFDATVAMGLSAGVIEPAAPYSLAAEGSFMLYHAASGQLLSLSGQGVAAGGATVDMFRSRGLDKVPTGPHPDAGLSFTVPGIMGAYLSLLERYGTKTFAETAAPAIDYARRGFPMYQFMRRMLGFRGTAERIKKYSPQGAKVFFSGDEPHEVGQLVVQEKLAATLSKMVDAEGGITGSRQAGLEAARNMFYRGDIAKTIVECSDRLGGLLTMEDLASYSPKYEDPLSSTFRGYRIRAQSTWTQGAVLLQALNILESFDLKGMGHNSARYIHTVAEAIKLAFADREAFYGDPDYAAVPIDGLLSKAYTATRIPLIQEDAAWPELPPAGDPWVHSEMTPPMKRVSGGSEEPGSGPGSDHGTTHLAAIDREGNIVCATPSGAAFFKSVYFPELGLALSTRSEMFFVDESHPNGIAPGKRPRTTLVNYMVCQDDQPFMTVGCPGGDNQAQSDIQLVLNVLVFGMNPQEAVEAPRFASQSVTNSFYPRVYRPGHLDVEPGIPTDVQLELESLGHKVVEAFPCGYGATVTRREIGSGVMSAGADNRTASYAIGW